MAGQLLFVYGSLKRNGRHHAELCGAAFLGEAQSVPGYALEPLGDYLALVEGGTGSVPGELFEVDEARLTALDVFEGDAYVRRALLVTRENGEKMAALAYVRRTR